MKYIRFYLVASILILWSASAAGQGCEYDTQCRGDRICENGRCVSEGGGSSNKNSEDRSRGNGLPRYCCTPAGRLGPYDNPGIPEGGSCFGTTTQGQQMMGQACH